MLSLQNFKYLNNKRVQDLRQSTQFLHILTAESEHLANVTVQLPPDAKADFERKLTTAFTSEQYDENAQQWNAERLRIIQENIEKHIVNTGVKWVREWIREEEEEDRKRTSMNYS